MKQGRAKLLLLLFFLAVLLTLAGPTLADAPIEIGRTIFVVNDGQGRLGEEQPKRVVLNDDVLYQEDIITADQAETIIEFRDGSTFEGRARGSGAHRFLCVQPRRRRQP